MTEALIVSATYWPTFDDPMAVHFESRRYETREEAVAFAARFPKAAKLRVNWVSELDGRTTWFARHSISVKEARRAQYVEDRVNQTGIKRYRGIIKAAKRAGIQIQWQAELGDNHYISREAFESALASLEG